MRKAFDKVQGPLTDPAMDEAEREMRAHLFAGAIGAFKNPHSHRNVALEDPNETAEIIMLSELTAASRGWASADRRAIPTDDRSDVPPLPR